MYKFSEDEDFARKLKKYYGASDSMSERRTGRSFLAARIMIEQAIETGQRVNIIDHLSLYPKYDTKRMDDTFIGTTLRDVLTWYKVQGVSISLSHTSDYKMSFCLESGLDMYQRIRISEPEEQFEVEKNDNKLLLLCL